MNESFKVGLEAFAVISGFEKFFFNILNSKNEYQTYMYIFICIKLNNDNCYIPKSKFMKKRKDLFTLINLSQPSVSEKEIKRKF